MNKKLTNQLIVITGVTKGLGRAMLDQFIALGHTVIGCGRSKAEIKNLCELYPSHHFAVVDVTQGTEVQQWANQVIKNLGTPDYLINNAAIINRTAALWDISEAEFSQLIDINIKGVANTIRAFLPAMLDKKAGMIINFSSEWGRSTSPEVAPYCASKWAIEGLSQTLSQEVPAGIGVIALNPGIINTQMLQSCWGQEAVHYPTPEQWAKNAVPFILSLNSQNNGQSLSVND
ncbi:SDR family oxidoreductase [Gloeothece verrucosa]|uniref:Short-chain dehydrogenase/reductase SDR n=1 Tax=Gloeothece verrucosa (strain PCC 7822) TaxID=497965 RepID=E0U649_GLOV7|nr:SDR family oxidoreductase [Gloeothece verrucosa]ADN12385.1 short-chain dehydrogenase/reductase SDR [Gloeothece verrucosa PCC 7822]